MDFNGQLINTSYCDYQPKAEPGLITCYEATTKSISNIGKMGEDKDTGVQID
jgi:hypothetical protein